MGAVTTQSVHPLTSCVAGGSERDPLGHLVREHIGDREFRFIKIKGESIASQGMALVAYRLSAQVDEVYDVTPFASANLTAAGRDFVGIMVGQSTAASGDFCWAMTKGKLGKVNGSLYPDTVFANVSTTAAAGQHLEARAGAGTSEFKLIAVAIASAGAMITEFAHVVGVALSTDASGKLTRGHIRSGLIHGGGFGTIV